MVSVDTKMMANNNRVIIKLSTNDYAALEKVAVKMRCSVTQAAKTLLGDSLDREAEA